MGLLPMSAEFGNMVLTRCEQLYSCHGINELSNSLYACFGKDDYVSLK